MITTTKKSTCSYFVSLQGKNEFTEVDCVESSPCRGFCSSSKEFTNLKSDTNYDILIIVAQEYGRKLIKNKKTSI